MAGGVVVDGVFTPSPGIYVTPKFDNNTAGTPGAGVVALVGSFPYLEKGVPYVSTNPLTFELLSPTDPALLRLSNLVWNPSDDPDMRGRPSAIVLASIDTATQASAFLLTSAPANGVQVKSKVWGPRGNMVRLTLTDNTDLLGVDVLAALNGATLDQFHVPYDDDVITLAYTNPGSADVVGTITGYGFTGAPLGAGASGTINVAKSGGNITVLFDVTLTENAVDDTGVDLTWVPLGPVNGPVTFTPLGAAVLTTATHLVIEFTGIANGAATVERRVLTAVQVDANTPTTTATSWSSLTSVKVYPSDNTAAQGVPGTAGVPTGTYSGGSIQFTGACFPTMNAANGQTYAGDVIRLVNGTGGGFSATTDSSRVATTELTQLDTLTTTPLTDGGEVDLNARAYRLVEAINTKSQLLEATLLLNVPIDLSGSPLVILLTGGTASAGSASDVPAVLDTLSWEDINTILPLSTDATFQGHVNTHLAFMSGAGANERNAWFAAAAGETYSQLLSRAKAWNTHHVSLVCEEADIPGYTGALERHTPIEYAISLACMQNGQRRSPLTRKQTRAKAVYRHSGTYTREAINGLVAGGVVLTVARPSEGLRIERWVTTHTQTTDPARTEGSAVDSTYDCARAVRTALRRLIGTNGTSLLKGVLLTAVSSTLDRLVREGVIRSWEKGTLDIIERADRYDVTFSYTPTYPFNFGVVTPTIKVPIAA